LSWALGDEHGIIRALHNLGSLAVRQQDPERAARPYEERLELYRPESDKSGIALLSLGLGAIARQRGDEAQARAYYEQSLAFSCEVGDPWNETTALRDLGVLACQGGHCAQAKQRLHESLDRFQTLDDQYSVAIVQADLGRVSQSECDLTAAAHLYHRNKESLRHRQVLENHEGMADSLERLAVLARSQARLDQAGLLDSAAARLREAQREWPVLEKSVTEHARMDALKHELGVTAFQRGWNAAQQWTFVHAVEVALML
jgi:tetratricopeptide (TPR) repeat protein